MRDAFAVLFFVSVGMLVDPAIIVKEPLPLLATLFIILVGKSVAAFAIVRLFGHPNSTALTISASLAQIGEFSFILVSLGVSLSLMTERGRDLVLAGAIISIMLNPLFFALLDRILVDKKDAVVPAGEDKPAPRERNGNRAAECPQAVTPETTLDVSFKATGRRRGLGHGCAAAGWGAGQYAVRTGHKLNRGRFVRGCRNHDLCETASAIGRRLIRLLRRRGVRAGKRKPTDTGGKRSHESRRRDPPGPAVEIISVWSRPIHAANMALLSA